MQIHYQKLINKRSAFFLSILLYLISLTQTGFLENKGYISEVSLPENIAGDPINGFYILEAGWLDIIVLDFAWYANIFYFLLYCIFSYHENYHCFIHRQPLLLAVYLFSAPRFTVYKSAFIYG